MVCGGSVAQQPDVEMLWSNMRVGDLIHDGFDNIGVIVELGQFFMTMRGNQHRAYRVHFFTDAEYNGWYVTDLNLLLEET